MRRILAATALSLAVLPATLRPAEAWDGGFALGTAAGLVAGTAVGTAIARPYGYYPYAYPYYYPPVVYPGPYGYAYPPVVYAPGYPPPPAGPGGYNASAAAQAPASRPGAPATACGTGQFFNTYTGTCDRR